jgi:GDP/UDP-N,N'-diacetylbacillosamine 2-epimerase (hydrolysing)
MKNRKICVVTGTRADYGLLYRFMKALNSEKKLQLQIIATGMHLSPEFGLTQKEIIRDGFKIDKSVEMLLSADTSSSISKSTGLGLIGFSDAFKELKPDIVVLLGDRYEIFSASIAATFAKIPIAHIHGGETSQGAYDEAIRHSISKMAWWHFVSTQDYKKRVIQLGEDPTRVYNVGGLGVDAIKNLKLLSKKKLIDNTGIKLGQKNLLVTYHPVTLENYTSKKQFEQLLNALNDFNKINIIFTMPNADSNSRIIKKMIDKFVLNNQKRAIAFSSMGHLNYLSTMQFIDGVLGNSSSGLMEAPTFKIGTINMGDRQKGRIKSESIIDCEPNKKSIKNAINKLFSEKFQSNLSTVKNPYEGINPVNKIIKILKLDLLPKELKKEFYDL